MRRIVCSIVFAAFLISPLACSHMSKSEKGAVIGGAAGGVLGAVIGKQAGNTAVGAIMGAVVGGTAGAVIGHYMDEQAEELDRDLEGATVERVGEGIKVTFASGILFDVNKHDLRPEAKENVTKLAGVLNKYPDTNILIEGHTDADGTEEYNQRLSERRAASVSFFLAQNSVTSSRVSTMGYGELQPVTDNSTPDGKQANRRVEVAIMANEKLKKAAQEKAN